MTQDITYRRATDDDIRPAYVVFRRSLFDYLFRQALVDEATAKDPPIESGWARQSAWIEHLWATSVENWVAVDAASTVIGWAMSVERDGALELTHFFVEPGIQARGIGRALLERAFPVGMGRHRSIVATQDAPALALYLRFGVGFVTTACDFLVPTAAAIARADAAGSDAGRAAPAGSGLEFERLGEDDASVALVADIEEAVLGFRREPDTRFLLGFRPGWIARRAGRAVGFAFGATPLPSGSDDDGPVVTGPIGALDPSDMPALIDRVIRAAADAGLAEVYVTPPLRARTAVDHLLAIGGRIDPFYTQILADDDSMRLDRWVHTGPVFIL